jgi:very-short-patch-repair endonuclease
MNARCNRRLTDTAQRLRRDMTKEYDCLKNLPVTMNRQKVIGHYIVDFYCASAKLVIEIDGSQHCEAKGAESDVIRDDYLKGLGLTVKRYTNADINQRFEEVSADIYNSIFHEYI